MVPVGEGPKEEGISEELTGILGQEAEARTNNNGH